MNSSTESVPGFQLRKLDVATSTPEHRLMLAVLKDALIVFETGRNSRSAQRRRECCEVELWFASRDFDSPFAFELICDALGLDASCVRAALRRIKVEQYESRRSTSLRDDLRYRTMENPRWKGRIKAPVERKSAGRC